MKIQEYIGKLYEDIDFEGGCLSELLEDTPGKLHIGVMEALGDKKIKKNSFITRRYFSAVAAIFIVVILISGIKNFPIMSNPKKAAMEQNLSTSNTALDTNKKYDKAEEGAKSIENNRGVSNETFEIMTTDADIIGYLQGHGESAGDNLYLLDKKYCEEFKVLLDKKKLSLTQLKDGISLTAQKSKYKIHEYIIIKILK